MSKRGLIISLSLVILCGLSMRVSWAQQQQSPPVPPHVLYGTASIGGNLLDRFDNQIVVSARMEKLLLIFLDSFDSQGTISSIVTELGTGNTNSLRQAFLDSDYCKSRVPPIELSQGATVTGGPNEWQVRDGAKTYTVVSQNILVWNGVNWVQGKKLEVYWNNGLIASYKMGDLPTDNYALQIPVSSDTVFWGNNNSYLLRDPGKAIAGEKAYIYIGNTRIDTPLPPYIITQQAFVEMNINAPSEYDWDINLPTGWFQLSFAINKCFYEGTPPPDQPQCVEKVNVADSGHQTLAAWFTSILTPVNQGAATWLMVLGPDGSAMASTGPSGLNTLKYMSPIYSYWVLIADNSGGVTMHLRGRYFDPAVCAIPLQEGWNMIGYPSPVGFYDGASPPSQVDYPVPEGTTWVKVPAPVANHVFADITGKYRMILTEIGGHDPNMPGFSGIHYIGPGHGIWIDMKQAEELTYPTE